MKRNKPLRAAVQIPGNATNRLERLVARAKRLVALAKRLVARAERLVARVASGRLTD